jgi:Phosphotransferase enzyme family
MCQDAFPGVGIVLPTGDGMAACFFDGQNDARVLVTMALSLFKRVAEHNKVELSKLSQPDCSQFSEQLWSNQCDAFYLRAAISSGELFKYPDYNHRENAAGDCLNEAARLLSIAGPNQILISKSAANILSSDPEWEERLREFLPVTVKGARYEGWQLIGNDCPYLNSGSVEKSKPIPPDRHFYNAVPNPWVATDHSHSQIDLVAIDDDAERESLMKLLNQHYSHLALSSLPEIERVWHSRSSRVYRVYDRVKHPDSAFMVKQWTTRTTNAEADIQNSFIIETLVRDHAGFGDDGKKRLTPILTDRQKPYEPTGVPDEWICMHPFLDSVSHFAANTHQEVASVAEQFAYVNNALARTPEKFKVEENTFLSARHLGPQWDKIQSIVKTAVKGNLKLYPALYYARVEADLINRLSKESQELVKSQRPDFVLNDFHPHNVFMRDGTCISIIDYEGATRDWPEEAACAFAMHRFGREYVRRQIEANNLKYVDAARDVIEAFLDAYGRIRGTDIVRRVRSNGIPWARAVNLCKLIQQFEYSSANMDSLNRTQIDWLTQALKFLSYFKELEVFEEALRNPNG